jgi:hypothetical protein
LLSIVVFGTTVVTTAGTWFVEYQRAEASSPDQMGRAVASISASAAAAASTSREVPRSAPTSQSAPPSGSGSWIMSDEHGCPTTFQFQIPYEPRDLCGQDLGPGWSPVLVVHRPVCSQPSGATVAQDVPDGFGFVKNGLVVTDTVTSVPDPRQAIARVNAIYKRDTACGQYSARLYDPRHGLVALSGTTGTAHTWIWAQATDRSVVEVWVISGVAPLPSESDLRAFATLAAAKAKAKAALAWWGP